MMAPGCDRISDLPESLLTHILSYLPTKHSVTTTALSTRWKNLWLSVPSLDLNCDVFPYREDEAVLSFLDRLLEFSPDSRLLKVKVKCGSVEIKGLNDRIRTVIQRGPQHLDVESCTKCSDPYTRTYQPFVEFMPLNLYTSKTLVSLKLKYSGVEDPGFAFMPCLKSMSLVEVHFRDDATLERLLSGCPVLEELTLVRDMHSSFVGEVDRLMRVRSGSLKRFRVPFWYGECCSSSVKCTLEIDAPRLERMTLGEDQFDSFLVKNLDSLFMVDLDISFVSLYFGNVFLNGILSVQHMIISEKTVKLPNIYLNSLSVNIFAVTDNHLAGIWNLSLQFQKPNSSRLMTNRVCLPPVAISSITPPLYPLSVQNLQLSPLPILNLIQILELHSRVGLIPKFNNLSRLEAVFPSNLLQFLPAFLECCPNLKHLILEVVYLRETEEDAFELTDVPPCFLSTLECVELKRIHDWEEEEKRVATYFLDKAAVLKKLISVSPIILEVSLMKKSSRRLTKLQNVLQHVKSFLIGLNEQYHCRSLFLS